MFTHVRPETFGRPSVRHRLRRRRRRHLTQGHIYIIYTHIIIYTYIAAIFNNKYYILV